MKRVAAAKTGSETIVWNAPMRRGLLCSAGPLLLLSALRLLLCRFGLLLTLRVLLLLRWLNLLRRRPGLLLVLRAL